MSSHIPTEQSVRQFVASLAIYFAFLFEPSMASDRFCIKPVKIDEAFGNTEFQGLDGFVSAANPAYDVYFLSARDGGHPARLVNDTFVPIRDQFPSKSDSDSIIATPMGEVIGIGGILGKRAIYRMNPVSGDFDVLQVKSSVSLKSLRDIAWSTPLNAPLLTVSGRRRDSGGLVLLLENNSAMPIKGITDWITHISDFPDLALTVLVSDYTETVFVIDAERTVHRLTDLDLGDWRFISQTFFLADPPRLLLDAGEALGPFRGLYLIQIENESGIWRPSLVQDWRNLMEDFPHLNTDLSRGRGGYDPFRKAYYFYGDYYGSRVNELLGRLFPNIRNNAFGLFKVGENGFKKIEIADPNFLQSLPSWIVNVIDPSLSPPLKIKLGDANAKLTVSKDSITVSDEEGVTYVPDGGASLFHSRVYQRFAWSLGRDIEALIQVNSQYYLLKDREIFGREACRTSQTR